MASFVGAIEQFNPYIQQIPTEAYTKVGMFKEQQYLAGIEKVQDNIDRIAGLDIANEGGRTYLKNRVDELTKSLNKYSMVDFSNPNNITQLVSLAKPLYQDENIVNDVINTGVYRKWSKEASDAFKAGKMELGQYMRETTDASVWLNSQVAGSQYTGRSTPNTATKKDLVDRIIKAKKDGLEKNEYVYDINYSKDTPYYVKSTNKYYSEADFNNFVSESLMNTRDREMLMNENWYENQGKSTLELQQEDLAMYQAKIDANNRQIENIINDPLLYAGDKKTEAQKVIDDLKSYNTMLQKGKIKFLQELNLADPASRDVFHRDLAESRFIQSLDILRDEVKKEELQKNEQWFKDKEMEIELAKEAMKAKTTTNADGTKKKTVEEITNEVAVYTPVDPSAPKTELSLNTIQRGWQMKNDEINASMNSLIGKLQQNGVDMSQFIAGWDQINIGTKGGASMSVPRFKDAASKEKFYNMVAGLNYAYTKEAEDGKLDNKSFTEYIKNNYTDYKDLDPNSKFNLADKIISDALNSLKGTSALLPKLEGLFADKGVTRTLAAIDQAIKNKKDMANAYREALLKSNALSGEEMAAIRTLSDDDLLQQNYMLDFDRDKKEFPGKYVTYRVGTLDGPYGYAGQEADGTYAIYREIWNDKNHYLYKEGPAPEVQKVAGGYTDYTEGLRDINRSGVIGGKKIITESHLKAADKFVKETYSYIQENLNSTVTNLKQDKPAYAAIQDGLTLFLTRARLQASPQDIQIDGVDQEDLIDISGINNVEVVGATVSNTEDIFNPNPMYEVTFKGTTGEGKEAKERTYSGRVSLKSFLATNPNYRTTEYARYFAPAIYAEQDAYARIKAAVNPLEGSEASYSNRQDIRPVYNYTTREGGSAFAYDDSPSGDTGFGNQYQWETIPIEKDGKQTMVSYQVVSLGQNTTLGNLKAKDGQQYAPGAYYIKMKVPTSNGQPKVIFLKRPNGESYTFQNASNAHYTIRDLIFNNPDIKFDEVNPQNGEINYFTVDPNTIRGIFNAQLSYNGYSKLEAVKIKDALGREIQKQEARELQLVR